MQSRPDNNVKLRNEIHKLLKGPVYLLPLKVPLILTGVILFIVYRAMKLTVKHSINILVPSIIHMTHVVEYIGHYLFLIFKIFFTQVGHISRKLYMNIVKPSILFTCKSIFPVIYNVSKRIFDAIIWFCVWCYQQIILPTFQFCYLRVIVPTSQWIIEFSVVFYSTLGLLFRKFRLACIWTWQNIFYPLWMFIFINVLLSFYQSLLNYTILCGTFTIGSFREACGFFGKAALLPIFRLSVKIGSFICTEFLAPLCEWLKDSMRIIGYYLLQLVLHGFTCVQCTIGSLREACASFSNYILLPLLRVILKICVHIYGEVLKPVCRLALYTGRMFCDKLYQFGFHPIMCLIYSMEEYFYLYLLQPLSNAVSTLLPIMTNTFNEIFVTASSIVSATALVMATLGTTIASIFRTDTHT